jgi:hypothetical protein
MTSYGRHNLAKFAMQFNDDIVKINTDCVVINRPLRADEVIYFHEYDSKSLILENNGREFIDKVKNPGHVLSKYKSDLTISYAMTKVDTKNKVLVQKDTWGACKIKTFKHGCIGNTGKLIEIEDE